MNTIVLEPDGRGSFTFTFSSPRGEMSGRVNVGTEGPPDRRSTADKKELVGLIDGVRESAQSWKELLLDLKRRGLSMAPELPVADGDSAFGRRSRKCGRRRAASVVGSTRLPTSSISCRRASNRKPSGRCRRSGWPRPKRMPSRRSAL